MSSDIAIRVKALSKCYHIYDAPRDRLKQFVLPRLQRAVAQQAKQYFREFWSLKNVSFEVKKGETVGIIGRNGSGKSTLLQMICGTLNPTSGSIIAHGRIAALLELGSGFNPEFTGRENVYLNGAVLGLSKAEIDARFDSIAAFADIGDFIEQPVKNYSSGMMVRLAFAVAISIDPDILIVDEALAVGDELFQRKCFSRIEAIRASGATILFVSHSGAQIVELCDRALLMDDGENLATGAPKEIVGCYQKLLYAPAEKRERIRGEIKLRHTSWQSHSTSEQEHFLEILAPQSEAVKQPERDNFLEVYDPELLPSSTVYYESHGAKISEAFIYNTTGERVNNLSKGERYYYRYRVDFESTAESVGFGMMIKTSSGVELGGARSSISMRDSISKAEVGDCYYIEFSFVCNMTPGVYFLNAGVVGDVSGSHTFLHRILDVAMFRVISSKNEYSTGLVDFLCAPNVQRVANG